MESKNHIILCASSNEFVQRLKMLVDYVLTLPVVVNRSIGLSSRELFVSGSRGVGLLR